jgi:hypothetical protein
MSNLRIEGIGAVASSTMGAIGALLDWPIVVLAAICLAVIVTWARISSTRARSRNKTFLAAHSG